MKAIYFKTIIAAILLFGLAVSVNAQTDTEKKMKELKERRALAREGKGLLTDEREANVGEDPCTMYDDDIWYAAFNQKEGTKGDPQLANTLLRLCQEQLKLKIKGRYQAVVRDYFNQMDIDGQSAVETHIESAGGMIIDAFLDDTREFCRKTSDVDARGNIIMYMSIKISKGDLVEKIAEGLSENKQAKVRFNEEKFRESALKVFQEDK
jgi:hypothetical protein